MTQMSADGAGVVGRVLLWGLKSFFGAFFKKRTPCLASHRGYKGGRTRRVEDMTRQVAVVFGGSGFVGRYVVKRLAAAGYVVRVAVRDTEAAMFLRPMGGVGQIVPLFAPVGVEAAVARAVDGADVVVNLTGILAEARPGDFERVHCEGAARIARLAASSVARHVVHVSAIGADEASESFYARSKGRGEAAVLGIFPRAVILRPSVIFGPEDGFFNRFAAMAQISPVVPVVGGKTKFQPVYVGDVADAVLAALAPAAAGQTYELGGPDVKTFKELIEFMLKIIDRKRLVLDLPLPLATVQAGFLERLPGQLLTRDQVKLLGRDNVVTSGALNLTDLGIAPHGMGLILPGYLARYRPGGRRREAALG
jgi:NADH dehydrogenase